MGRPTEAIGKAMGKIKGAKQRMTGGAGIFERLATEHGEVSTMMRRVGVSTGASTTRDELFPRIKLDLLAHAKAEEEEVYAVFRKLPGLADKMDHAADEHAEVERLLEELSVMECDDDGWFTKFHELSLKVQKHVIEEEQQIFPRAKDALTREESEDLEQRYLAAKARFMNRT